MSTSSSKAPTRDGGEAMSHGLSAEQQSALDAEIRAEMAARRTVKPWVTGLIVLITGLVSLYSAFMLATERVEVAENENYTPACTAGIYFRCTNVMLSPQAETFHFANYFYGMAGFGLMMGFGVLLMAGATLPLWLKRAYVIGQFAACVFLAYLVYSVVFAIGTMCLWCMLVWAMMAIMFAYLQSWAQDEKLFNFGPVGTFLRHYPWLVVLLTYIAIVMILYSRFGNALFDFS
ncbi:hypothetical protein JT358_02965 [Micrococcales bacterium 31B]|nr:hypothetical protein [Micrococcales bacterium 31B]